VLQQFGGVLKQVTNSPACGAAVWGLLGRWYALQDQHLSSQEARLKQVGAWVQNVYCTIVSDRLPWQIDADQCLVDPLTWVCSCSNSILGVWVILD
jgi:hypothetical protein